MAIASVELGKVAFHDRPSGAINGPCIRSEELTVSGSTATLATAITTSEIMLGVIVARVATDTACYVAVGPTPDPDATVRTDLTTAGRLIPANGWIELPVSGGDKVAVKAA